MIRHEDRRLYIEDHIDFDIKERRKSLGLTLAGMAKQCGVSLTTYAKWENGLVQTVRADKLVRLMEILDGKK